jgi:hypothetical protein
MHTIDAIRQGIRTATTRCYKSEIDLIKGLVSGQMIRFNRYDSSKNIVDSIIVFAANNEQTNTVGYKLPSYNDIINNDQLLDEWCKLEAWDIVFAKAYFNSNKTKELWQFKYSLYPPKYNYSPELMIKLRPNEVFVFGANTEMRHGAGAAKLALNWGATYSQINPFQSSVDGNSYALITTDLTVNYRPSISLELLQDEVNKFIEFATNNKELTFLVTEVGCGLAGFTVDQVAPLFKSVLLGALRNIRLPRSFVRCIVIGLYNKLNVN